ncbi:hypothetical protein GlitD10_1024 [Gloeomargarita lithophora Alchichica-D10]|uniref:Uncharacterized protein n=1 Tax=Gloeomargarita lithophora Alchichica-D10 TaxID=1188229 RepID=A0A1J0ABN9_9CYAN|nr:hypothetical protein [Gloeomargarita lithophora]APB33344.1 hypothetical protein GlitD10_1024 [Gloeomargarita lithophora Alchichica-D10]
MNDPQLQAIQEAVRAVVQERQGDAVALLAVLRLLEFLHREIESGSFTVALPQTRQDLYDLLLDIETQGGWPYIYRRSLESLLVYIRKTETANEDTPPA